MTTEQSTLSTAWYRKRRSWIIAASLFALLLVILVSLPYGIQFGLADFLKQHGARQVEISNIDFNPFTGRLLFQQVVARSAEGERLRLEHLELDFGWRDLFSKRARIQAVDLRGLEASVDLTDPARLRVSGLTFPLGGEGKEAASETPEDTRPWGFALDRVELQASAFKLRQHDLLVDVELERLTLQRVISWQLQQVAELVFEGRVNGAPLNTELRATLFDETREVDGELELQGFDLATLQPLLTRHGGPRLKGALTLQQAFKFSLSSAGDLQGGADGLLQGELPQLQLPEEALDLSLAGYRWQGELEFAQGRSGLTLKAEGGLALEQAAVVQAERQPQRISVQRLGLQALTLQLQQSPEGAITLSQHGELSLDGLALLQHQLLAELSALQWQGGYSVAPSEVGAYVTAEGDGRLEGLRLREEGQEAALAALQRVDLSNVKLAPGNELALASVILQGIRLDAASVDKEDPLLQNQSLVLKDIRFAETAGLSVGLLEQQEMQARLVLDKQGRLNLQGLAEQLQAAALPKGGEAGESKEEASAEEPMPIIIERIVMQGDNRVDFQDLSVLPHFQAALDVKKLELSGIDSSRPQRPSPFSFVGSSGRHAEIKAEGEITLFRSDPDGRLKAELQGVEMLPLSSYTIPAIGYRLDSGVLDAEVDLALKQGDMEGNNHLVIRRLEVSQASAAEAEKLEAQIAMPLDTALGMLQDKNQTIDLNLPVSGKLSDPDVGLGDVINTALGNALKKGAMTYLTTALFPYGTMVALLKMAGEEAGAVRLNPVEFPPAAALLDDQDRDYLGKVGQVLKERPKIAIKLCGTATQADRRAISEELARQAANKEGEDKQAKESEPQKPPEVADEQLLTLARSRAEMVQDYLIKQQG
ncbi:MAG: DUF748 domain-containing protein, partial [Chromatiales bacterium]